MDIVIGLFLITLAAVIGGVVSKIFKLPSMVGYVLSGVVFGVVLPNSIKSVGEMAQIGTILLLFSIGLELSFDSLSRFFRVSVFGSLIQIILASDICAVILIFLGIDLVTSLILSIGFALSSTAVVVKILGDRGESDTIHGSIMLGWLLVQDLAVIPIVVMLPMLSGNSSNFLPVMCLTLLKIFGIVGIVIIVGRLLIPCLIHKIADTNSRELLLLTSVAIALGTAGITSFFGISPALGAFLAGVVISENQEHHAIFAETRPIRDLFVALFFVSLGFFVTPSVIFNNLTTIVLISLSVLLVKIFVTFLVSQAFGYEGKTAILNSFGLSQVGEFAFVVYSVAYALGLINNDYLNIGIAVTLITLIVSPILYNMAIPLWRKIKFIKIFKSTEKSNFGTTPFQNHIIICGYGRVGKWVGHAMSNFKISFVVVEYNQKIVQELISQGIPVVYGDPTEPEVLEAVFLKNAKALVIAIPDRIVQEMLISYVQKVAPDVKIITRVHQDVDWDKLKSLKVDKIVQPEFEASLEIVRSILRGIGKSKEEIIGSIKSLRVSHSR
jgi:CPA2 family monovalent cation:H+ antiporter-2